MKIRISTIPAQGLKVTTTLPREPLNARMNEGSESEILFTHDPVVDIVAHKTPNGAETVGSVSTKFTQDCARCDDPVDRALETRLDYALKKKPESGEAEDDIGIAYFEGDHFDLEDLVQETLILALSLYWSPPLDAEDRCGTCKRLFKTAAPKGPEKKTTFGDLMQKAKEGKRR